MSPAALRPVQARWAVFGFSRTGARLEEAITQAIESLLEAKAVGEGAVGIRKRE